jgi:hypothetical protein
MPHKRILKKGALLTSFEMWIVFVATAILTASLIFYAKKEIEKEISLANDAANAIFIPRAQYSWIEIDFGNGKKRLFQGRVEEEVFLSAALSNITRDNKLSFLIKNGSIQELDGKKNATDRWRIYKNGEQMPPPLNLLLIASGDHYTIRYEH